MTCGKAGGQEWLQVGFLVSWSDFYGRVVILVEFIGLAQPDVILAPNRMAVEHPAVSPSLSACLNEACHLFPTTTYAIRDSNKPALTACLYLKKLSASLYSLHWYFVFF